MIKRLLLVLTAAVLFVACLKNDRDTGCPYTRSSKVAPQTEQDAVATYLDTNGLSATKHSQGFYYEIVNPGAGADTVGLCSQVRIDYSGKFVTDSVFDAQNDVWLVLGSLIDGWKSGIPLVRKGGEINLYIPPSLGYGSSDYRNNLGQVLIPGNSILIFNVKVKEYTISQ